MTPEGSQSPELRIVVVVSSYHTVAPLFTTPNNHRRIGDWLQEATHTWKRKSAEKLNPQHKHELAWGIEQGAHAPPEAC
eukprot:CAMPEP_0206489828 /NCGR_PEP_ID=MMETSP0324_2-20121206/43562_1 /ASSEMBLY_ACC=CAM_ASM_000836 /TAXON_ID=2866 /ORGANISM="Crypthecodinium cohnii, Strain Seligo" /LENGTH=78 /DNA_ID=CAMNT_0053969761 /DNA_START=24 /DNA_END=257 /DNA_ORIENTATION=-